jgi:hypothetical protein
MIVTGERTALQYLLLDPMREASVEFGRKNKRCKQSDTCPWEFLVCFIWRLN